MVHMVDRETTMPTELLIDANSAAYRMLFAGDIIAVQHRGNKILTGIPHGVLAAVASMRSRNRFDRISIFWDGGISEKKKIYPEYKKNRKNEHKDFTREDIVNSTGMTIRMARFAGIPQYRVKGQEADDIIASYAAACELDVMILSSDHDFFQLLGPGVKMLRPTRKGPELWTAERFQSKYGYHPRYYAHYLALVGDPGDGIPGVKGIGKVTADAIFSKLKKPTLKKIYSQIDRLGLKPRAASSLRNGRPDAATFLKITKLRKDIELQPLFTDVKDEKKLLALFKMLKMRSFQSDIAMGYLCNG